MANIFTLDDINNNDITERLFKETGFTFSYNTLTSDYKLYATGVEGDTLFFKKGVKINISKNSPFITILGVLNVDEISRCFYGLTLASFQESNEDSHIIVRINNQTRLNGEVHFLYVYSNYYSSTYYLAGSIITDSICNSSSILDSVVKNFILPYNICLDGCNLVSNGSGNMSPFDISYISEFLNVLKGEYNLNIKGMSLVYSYSIFSYIASPNFKYAPSKYPSIYLTNINKSDNFLGGLKLPKSWSYITLTNTIFNTKFTDTADGELFNYLYQFFKKGNIINIPSRDLSKPPYEIPTLYHFISLSQYLKINFKEVFKDYPHLKYTTFLKYIPTYLTNKYSLEFLDILPSKRSPSSKSIFLQRAKEFNNDNYNHDSKTNHAFVLSYHNFRKAPITPPDLSKGNLVGIENEFYFIAPKTPAYSKYLALCHFIYYFLDKFNYPNFANLKGDAKNVSKDDCIWLYDNVLMLENDSSLKGNGYELIFHAKPLKQTLDFINILYDAYNYVETQMKSNVFVEPPETESVGVHIHITRPALLKSNRDAMAFLRAVIYNSLSTKAGKSLFKYTHRKKETRFMKFSDVNIYNINERYQAINYTNTNTIEFRIFQGGKTSEAILKSWVCFARSLVDYVLFMFKTNKDPFALYDSGAFDNEDVDLGISQMGIDNVHNTKAFADYLKWLKQYPYYSIIMQGGGNVLKANKHQEAQYIKSMLANISLID